MDSFNGAARVRARTREEGKARLLSYDGSEATIKEITGSKEPVAVVGKGGDAE